MLGAEQESSLGSIEVLRDTKVVDSDISTEGWIEFKFASVVDCVFTLGKLNQLFPSVIYIPFVSYEDGKNFVGEESLKTGCVSCEGFGSGFILVCEDPTLMIPKASEVSSQILCTEGLKGLGRVLGDKVDRCSVSGGSESQIVDVDCLRDLGDGGVSTYLERIGIPLVEGCVLSEGSFSEGMEDVFDLRSVHWDDLALGGPSKGITLDSKDFTVGSIDLVGDSYRTSFPGSNPVVSSIVGVEEGTLSHHLNTHEEFSLGGGGVQFMWGIREV
jgi:hypothetical protein